jgi:carboxymethylenebutenolidase
MTIRRFALAAVVAGVAAGPVDIQGAEGTQTGTSVPAPGRAQQTPPIELQWNDRIPPGNADHAARALKESSRHGEWVDIQVADGTKLNSWIVYPEKKEKAGVVLVIHDINGMRDWPRALGDQLAQDGFIAIVPDFLSGKGPDGGGSASLGSAVGQTIRTLTNDEMTARLNAAMEYGKKLPASNGKTAVIGFCWGGTRSFAYAIAQPGLNASVVYYGDVPGSTAESAPEADLAKIKAPVIAMYGGNDARINATVPPTTAAMQKLGKTYEPHTFEGAGHGFLGNQGGAGGANLKAAEQAWPLTIAFLTKHLK